MIKNENIIILRPVKIYIDELEEIFQVLHSKYKEEDLIIETDNYIYNNFEEMTRSPENYIYRLKILAKGKKGLEINFKDIIYIKSDYENNLGILLKVKSILSNKRISKNLFLYYFVKYNRIWFSIFVFIIPASFSLIFKNFQSNIYIFFIVVILYVFSYGLFARRNEEKILYSTIALFKKSSVVNKNIELKEKRYPKFSLTVSIIGLFIPFIILLINFIVTKLIEK